MIHTNRRRSVCWRERTSQITIELRNKRAIRTGEAGYSHHGYIS
jgi:hypothetical protein